MKARILFQFTGAIVVTAFSAHFSACLGQGSLTPPGAPAAGMLTLSQVEPRTPVDAAHLAGNGSAQFAIVNPGSYYLTTNIVATGSSLDAIYIAANDVTLDLNGFSLLGTSSGSGLGIFILSGTNITVRDGLINGWTGTGLYCGAANVVLDNLTVTGNGGNGINLSGPGRCLVENCFVNGNAAGGIYCAENNVTFEQLVVSSNNPGVFINGVSSGVMKDCTVNENISEGVECVSSTNLTLEDLTISHNSGYGMDLNGTQNSTVSNCRIEGNANNTGIYLAGSSCFILGNSCSGNGISIFVSGPNNQIDGNHVNGSNPASVGIWINNAAGITNNIVTRNFVTGYGANDYSFGPSQIVGPIITNVVSEIITNSNPWANIAF